MELIDTHCHLTNGRLRRQLPEALRAREAGVAAVVCAAASAQDAKAAFGLAQRHEGVYFTAGVHPHDAKDAAEGCFRVIEGLAGQDKCVAIGEIGLDYHYSYSPADVQRRVFAEQLALAKRLGKRIVVHTREAFDETLAILAESGAGGEDVVFHSFTEGPDRARRVLEIGATISFSGIVTFQKAVELHETARMAPDESILIETDAPFLSPEPVRKMKVNEPANVAHVAAALAALRNASVGRIAELTTANARASSRSADVDATHHDKLQI